MIRLNERTRGIRERRCAKAPKAEKVARKIAKWAATNSLVGTYEEPVSFELSSCCLSSLPTSTPSSSTSRGAKGSRFGPGEVSDAPTLSAPTTSGS